MGGITKAGSKHLRWAMIECVHVHVRWEKDSNITRFYNKVAARKGSAKATVAAASKMLRVIYWMLKENRKYRHYSWSLLNCHIVIHRGYCEHTVIQYQKYLIIQ